MSETCRHSQVVTYSDDSGTVAMWACAECMLRFYPACHVCIDVGHRNIDHPLAQSTDAASDLVYTDDLALRDRQP